MTRRQALSWLRIATFLSLATISLACARTGDPAIDDINTATVTTTTPAADSPDQAPPAEPVEAP